MEYVDCCSFLKLGVTIVVLGPLAPHVMPTHLLIILRSYGFILYPLLFAPILRVSFQRAIEYSSLVTNNHFFLDEALFSCFAQIELLSQFAKEAKIFYHVLNDCIGIYMAWKMMEILYGTLLMPFSELKKKVVDSVYQKVKLLNVVSSMIEKEADKLEESLEKSLKANSRSFGAVNRVLPKKGVAHKDILAIMETANSHEDVKWQSGLVSGGIYHGGSEHIKLLNTAFGKYSISNPLHPDIWPSVMKFEAEVVAMTASLVDGGLKTVCGCTTSGGTESIILAIKAHRDYYRENYGITRPELIAGTSAHAAVNKACDMMDIKLIQVPMDTETYMLDVKKLKSAITSNTIMFYASAPSFPQGVIDPIKDIGQLAAKYSIGLHVDCCLGGFFLPFAKRLGYNIPDFDFGVAGVTSMSLDTHKYGYALKGTSVVLYRNKEIRHSMYFCYPTGLGVCIQHLLSQGVGQVGLLLNVGPL